MIDAIARAAAPAGPASALAIDVHGLCKSYGGRAVVDHVDLQVQRGRICGFLGPNGSGKTTTIRMLCGLLTPDAGNGTCLGLDLRTDAAGIKRQVGYMTQKFGLYDDLSIRENLDFMARLFELPNRPAEVNRALDRLGLAARQRQLAGTLSGGWKQRLALAGEGITVLVSTHYVDEALRCDQLCNIAYGRMLAQGTASKIVADAGASDLEDAFVRLVGQAQDNLA